MKGKINKLIDKLNYEIEFYNLHVADYNREIIQRGKVYGQTYVYLYDQAERVESAALELNVYLENILEVLRNYPKFADFVCKLHHTNAEYAVCGGETMQDKAMNIRDIAKNCRIYLGDSLMVCDKQFETIDKYSD